MLETIKVSIAVRCSGYQNSGLLAIIKKNIL